MDIKKIGVLGAGAMGSGIAHIAALAGYQVVLGDMEMSFIEKAVAGMGKLMDKNIQKGKMTPEEKQVVLDRFILTTNIEDFATVDYMIEAIIEDLDIKKATFAKLDQICRPGVIIASNTSSMSITVLASATGEAGEFRRNALL